MITVEIIGIGIFREILQKSKITLDIEPVEGKPVTVYTVLETLDRMYAGQFAKELKLEDGTPNLWTRIMLNGRDIRFLDEDKLFVHDNDSVLISSVMAGG